MSRNNKPALRVQAPSMEQVLELQDRAETNYQRCLQCLSCSGGCPFVQAMDLGPNRVIRLLQLGFLQEALQCSTIWICVGCNTCSAQCPMAIDIASVMDVLREKALELRYTPANPEILRFHQEILNSIKRHGRTHKLEIMLRYKLYSKAWFDDLDLGLRMLSKRKLDLLPSNIENLKEVSRLFQKPWQGS